MSTMNLTYSEIENTLDIKDIGSDVQVYQIPEGIIKYRIL